MNAIDDNIDEDARDRGWKKEDIDLLMENGNEVLAIARTEMFPLF